jgi:hypothetical protein
MGEAANVAAGQRAALQALEPRLPIIMNVGASRDRLHTEINAIPQDSI